LKDKTTAALLALFLGGIGVHKFYLGRGGQGIFYLLFFWTFIPAVIAFIEAIVLFTMSQADFNLKYNTGMMLAAAASPQNIVVNVANTAHASTDDITGKLKSLNDLRVAGALTEEEFQAQKQRVLSGGR
jgi:TM2 domain-containing membrane protein YozV